MGYEDARETTGDAQRGLFVWRFITRANAQRRCGSPPVDGDDDAPHAQRHQEDPPTRVGERHHDGTHEEAAVDGNRYRERRRGHWPRQAST